MQPALTIIGALVALVATSVGVIAAIEQLTLPARLRRTAELAQALAEHEEDEQRQTVLRSIHDVAVARLVAGWLLPWRRFSEFAVTFLGMPFVVGGTVAGTGWNGFSLMLTLLCFVVVTATTSRGVGLYLVRQRIAGEYLTGSKITPPSPGLLRQMEGGLRAEFIVGALGSAGITLAAAGVGTLLHAPDTSWAIVVIVFGLIIAWLPVNWLRARAVRPLATGQLPRKGQTDTP